MNFQFQPSGWSCLPTAFGMVLDILADEVISHVGHDGSEIIWPELDEPYCRRGFSISEMTNFSLSHGAAPVVIDMDHLIIPNDPNLDIVAEPNKMFHYYLDQYPGVILADNHAVAWDNEEHKVYDPMKGIRDISGYDLECFIALIRFDRRKDN